MKICVLLECNLSHLRGTFMAIHNRMKYYMKDSSLEVSLYNFRHYYDTLSNLVKGNKPIEKKNDFYYEGIHYHCLYYKRSYIDYICRSISNYQTTIEVGRIKQYSNLFRDYNLIFAHSLYTGLLAADIKNKYDIPYVMMWHGSSIHTAPFKNQTIYKLTSKVLTESNHNFFVSKELMDTAEMIASNSISKSVSLNGVDTEEFYRYKDDRISSVSKKLLVDRSLFNIAFIGNYLPIKNVQYLPKLFNSIYMDYKDTFFHIIGTGPFKEDFANINLPVRFWGNQRPSDMPDIYNCMDLIVQPSFNEGLPMTCLESLACGTSYIGSRVGGIADVAGVDNTIPVTPSFEEDFAKKCKAMISQKNILATHLNNKYEIKRIVNTELKVIKRLSN